MKKQIVNMSVLQNAKVAAAMYFVISVPMVLLMLVPMMLAGQSGPGLWVMILAPVFYVLFGFIFTAIAAWLYNLIAARIGGIEFTTAEVSN